MGFSEVKSQIKFSENKSYPIKFNNAPMKSVDFSCDGRLIVTGSDDKSIKVINIPIIIIRIKITFNKTNPKLIFR